ncbi:uncharacterized protein Z519_03471 [Cladophialophora bantiana CBS 173.52]|uniref:3-hydroxyisobutyrate dehydrogenase n=1 Tax=Cladophialophora bantiana (strain ATCC 10958 / CBS 173.52 / CDC B-1940 / NIH 8579) TaxID=1442370 RepID=A0A0D2GDC8_CLAB1|nr:uncharacterized protein Z519_03471 [Cladophialophora bantiana CBS 173.52]KIW96402.1 hypothetical protein Z519_03471 [Cladophialophora bantiana CBS 173.52]
MGYAMASNIRKKISRQTRLYVNDINRSACERFIQEFGNWGQIHIVDSAKAAAALSKVVVSIVPGAADVREVYLNSDSGVIAASKDPERLMLDCSTIDCQTSRNVGEILGKAGSGTFCDAPVSGGLPGAEAGTLSFLIGHSPPSENDLIATRIETVITMMGSPERFYWCNTPGSGLAAKIANNYLSCTILLATAEAMAIGIRQGINPTLLYQCIKHSTGQSWMCDNVQPVPGILSNVPSSNGYKPGFKTQMMIKDITLGVEAGREVGIEPRMAETALKVFEKAAVDPRCVDRDGSSIYLYLTGDKEEDYQTKDGCGAPSS